MKGVKNGEEIDVRVEVDDIDHFGNRRSAPSASHPEPGPTGLRAWSASSRAHDEEDVEAITPQTLINIRPVVASIKEFFGTSQLRSSWTRTTRSRV